MSKRNRAIRIILFVLSLVAVLFVIGNRTKHIAVSLQGCQVSLFNKSDQKKVNVVIEGDLSYRFFQPEQFSGHIAIDGYNITRNKDYTTDIIFHNGYGLLIYQNPYSMKKLGYICTKDFRSLLILLYDDSDNPPKYHTFICAPADTAEEAYNIANKLSADNWMREIDWDARE